MTVGITLTQQLPVNAAADVVLDGRSPSDFWKGLADQLGDQLTSIVREHLRDTHYGILPLALQDVIDSDEYYPHTPLYARVFSWLVSPKDDEYHQRARKLFQQIGQSGIIEIVGDAPLEHIRTAVVPLFAASSQTPTIIVRFDDMFKEQRADQRRRVCSLLSWLAQAFDIQLVTETLYQQRWLAHHHRADLPGSVKEQCNTGSHSPACVENLRGEGGAFDTIDPDSATTKTLQRIADEPSETISYDRLYTWADVSRSRVRQRLNELRQFNLVSEGFDGPNGTRVELLQSGSAFLDAISSETSVQTTLEDCVSGTGNSSPDMPCKHASEHGGEEESPPTSSSDRNRLPLLHTVGDLRRSAYTAAIETASDNGFTVVNHPIEGREDRAAPQLHYDDHEDKIVVSVEADNPLSLWVSVAHALTDHRIWEWVIPPERLEENEAFRPLFDEYREVLRSSRCLGYLSDDVTTTEEYVTALQDARDELLEMTKKLRHDEYDDRARFRGDITREALGLVGTMTHLFDIIGVDLVREVRIPTFQKFGPDRQHAVARSLAIGAAIGSHYGENAAFRQLFEDDEERRRWAISPTIDASDPFGKLIGSFVVVANFGDSPTSFVDVLREHLDAPADLHEDAPEFAVPISIKYEFGRETYAGVVRRMCRYKSLRATREAVSVFRGLIASPYAVARAFNSLSSESGEREIRIQEVRHALQSLPPEQLFKDAPPTIRRTVHALLRADEPLSQSTLADQADVSIRSLRDHLPRLVAINLVTETERGYRLELSFEGEDERYTDRLPVFVGEKKEYARDILYEALEALSVQDRSVWSVWEIIVDGVPPVERLVSQLPWIGWVLPTLRRFCDQIDSKSSDAQFGVSVRQTSIENQEIGRKVENR